MYKLFFRIKDLWFFQFRFCFIFSISILCGFDGVAQTKNAQQRLDSLLSANQANINADTNKVKTMIQVMRQYMRMKNYDQGERYAQEAVQMAHKLKNYKLSGITYQRLGSGYHNTNFLKSEENYLKSIREFDLSANPDDAVGTYLNLGALYMGIPDYGRSLEAHQKAIVICNRTGENEVLASCYANVATIYHDLHQDAKTVEYMDLALKIFAEEGEFNRGTGVACESIAMAYFSASKADLEILNVKEENRLSTVLKYLDRALKCAVLVEDRELEGDVYSDFGKVYEQMGDKVKALAAYKKAIERNEGTDIKRSYANGFLSLGSFYMNQKDYDQATIWINKGLDVAVKYQFYDYERDANQNLSIIFEQMGNYSKSLAYFKQYIKAKENIINQENEKEITRRQLQFEFGVKENEYLLKQKITNGELQRQVLIAGQQEQQLKLRQQQLALLNKEQTLQRLTFLSEQARMESERKLQNSNFQRSTLMSKYQTSLRDKQIFKQNEQIVLDRRIRLFLLAAILLVFFVAGLIYFNQRKTTRLNKIINQQKLELEQLGKVKDRIFSVVSHDMRTPVNSLISFIQLLENGDIEQTKLKRYAASLKNNLQYTSSMMENLLNWAASQMQGFNPYLEVVNVKHLADEVINSLSSTAALKHISIENSIDESITCMADENMFTLVLRNLISNSIKFTPEEGKIKLSVEQDVKNLLLKVNDNGRGMTPEQVQHFNKSGYQGAGVSTPGTNKEKGTGLGLLLCRTFMQMMDGKITVNSTQNEGSQFNLWLKAP